MYQNRAIESKKKYKSDAASEAPQSSQVSKEI